MDNVDRITRTRQMTTMTNWMKLDKIKDIIEILRDKRSKFMLNCHIYICFSLLTIRFCHICLGKFEEIWQTRQKWTNQIK